MENPHQQPEPLSEDEFRRIVVRLRDLLGDDSVVLIGGSAVSLWYSQLISVARVDALATRDLDFIGDQREVAIAARLLNGVARPTRFRDLTTEAGEAHFQDSQGQTRAVDFLRTPYGVEAEDMINRAIPIDYAIDDAEPVRIFVMHPLDCLRSRIANNALPNRDIRHGHAQIRAAIALVPAYGRLLLDNDAPLRDVLKINQEVYDIALNNRGMLSYQAMRLFLDDGIDIEEAVLHDERLPHEHLQMRLPQLAAQLAARREAQRRSLGE